MPEEFKPYKSKLLPIKAKLRKFTKMHGPNDGSRTLLQSVFMPQVELALKDWAKLKFDAVLIGDLAVSYYVKPFHTEEIELLCLGGGVPDAPNFRRCGPRSLLHAKTNVEIKFLTPAMLKVPKPLARKVYETAIISDGIKIANLSGLVALKLHDHDLWSHVRVIDLLKLGQPVSVDRFYIGRKCWKTFQFLREEARKERERERTDPVKMEERAYREAQRRRIKGK